MDSLQNLVRGVGESLNTHALEDADREGKWAGEIGIMRTELTSLKVDSQDRQKFIRGWIAGLIAVSLAAGIGFLFRSAIDVQIARPVQSPAPVAPARSP